MCSCSPTHCHTLILVNTYHCHVLILHSISETVANLLVHQGLIHEWKQALLAPPLPLMSLNNSRLCSTHNHSSASCPLQRSTNDILCILVKAQPGTQSSRPRSPTRLGIRSQDLGLPNEYSLGHCGLSAASRQECSSAFLSTAT